jgi:hypothetical protein
MKDKDDKKTTPAKKTGKILLADHRPALLNVQRRLMLRSALSVGALSMLSGCDLQDNDSVDKVLWAMSRWNDRVQALLFRGQKLAPTYAASQITNPFPFNAFYDEFNAPDIDGSDWRWRSRDWSATSAAGPWSACAHCRRRRRSRAISASKDGAPSASGRGYR